MYHLSILNMKLFFILSISCLAGVNSFLLDTKPGTKVKLFLNSNQIHCLSEKKNVKVHYIVCNVMKIGLVFRCDSRTWMRK